LRVRGGVRLSSWIQTEDKAFDILGGIVAEAENPASDAIISTDTSNALGNGLSSLVMAGVVNPALDPAAPNPAARGLSTLSAMAGTLSAGMVDGEDAAMMASDVLTMRTQQEDLTDPNSRAFAAPLDTPGGLSSVSFPASLGEELARRRRRYLMSDTVGSTAINLFTSTVDPHANLTADANATRGLRRALLQALDEAVENDAPEAASVSAVVTSIGLSAGGVEVAVSGLEMGITFTLPVDKGGGSEGGGNRSAPAQCAYYDEAKATYSREGCVALPAPAPPEVLLQWRTLNVSKVDGRLERMWEVDSASSSSWFLSGCEESFDAVYPEYIGTDAGMRKYLGEGCVAADPENNASCWWQWESQAFVGAGCEWGSHVHCLCTHLTDFKATQDQELGSAEPPKGSFISAEDMAALSPSDLVKSALLLGILVGLMGGCFLLAQLSNYLHMTEKEGVFRQLLRHYGSDRLWFQYAGGNVWTWSLTLEETYGTGATLAVENSGNHPGTTQLDKPGAAGIPEPGEEAWTGQDVGLGAYHLDSADKGMICGKTLAGVGIATSSLDARSTLEATSDPLGSCRSQPVTEAHQIRKLMDDDAEEREDLHEMHRSKLPKREHSVAESGPRGVKQPPKSFLKPSKLQRHQQGHHASDVDALGLASLIAHVSQQRLVHHKIPRMAIDTGDGKSKIQKNKSKYLPQLDLGLAESQSLRRTPLLTPPSLDLDAIHNPPHGDERAENHQPPSNHRNKFQIVGKQIILVQRILQAVHREDLTASSELCRVMGLDFTGLMLAMPVAMLKKQAEESSTLKGAHIRTMLDSTKMKGRKGGKEQAIEAGDAGAGGPIIPASSIKPSYPSRTYTKGATSVLSFERLMGTSLVHAYLSLHSVLVEELQLKHLDPASSLRWSCPEGKDFNWFNLMFQELLALGKKPGWYLRAQLFNLVFLRDKSGGYQLSQELADTLRAGVPRDSLEGTPNPMFDLEELHRTLPAALSSACKMEGGEEEAQHVWATMLALALYDHLPFKWTMNPEAPPRDRITLGAVLEEWLEGHAVSSTIATLRGQAADRVVEWQDAHVAGLTELRERLEPSGAGLSKQKAPLWERTLKWVTGSLFFIVSSHPLVAIYLVKPMEAFSRAERLIVQVNVFVVMLSCCMAFYYSKAITTCVDFQSYVGCPNPNADAPDCFGLTMCMDIMIMKKDEMYPEEVRSGVFVFMGFPQNTWMGRIWTVLIINAVLIPVNVFLMALFSLSGASAAAPGHFGMDVAAKTSQLMGPNRGAALTNLFMVLYAVFFDIKILTKAMAMLFMAIFAMLFKPVGLVTKWIKPVLRQFVFVSRWLSKCREYLWSKGVSFDISVRSCWAFGGERKHQIKSPYQDPVHKHQIRVEGMMGETADKVAYSCLALFWGMTIWVLLTLGMQIRLIMGPDAETDLVKAWAMTLLFEQFGIKALKLLMVRSTGRSIAKQYDKMMTGKELFDIIEWYEGYIMNFPLSYFPVEQDADAFFGNSVRFKVDGKDDTKLGIFVVYLQTPFENAGVDVASFDLFDDTTREVLEFANTLVHNTLFEVIEPGSGAGVYFVSTDFASERDGRRALLDLVKGCIPLGVRTSHQARSAFHSGCATLLHLHLLRVVSSHLMVRVGEPHGGMETDEDEDLRYTHIVLGRERRGPAAEVKCGAFSFCPDPSDVVDGETDIGAVDKLGLRIAPAERANMDYLRQHTRLFFEDLEKNGPPEWLAINTHKIWH
ncbi:hypothetical protein CYMTET_49101, partial [Cymbomonas tetramitiformis]